MSRKDRILAFLFFLHLFEEARSGNRDGERISVKEVRRCLPRNATFPSAEGGKIYVALSFLSLRLRRFPFPSSRFSFREAAGRRMYALRRRGINKKTAAERRALRCLRDSWKKSFVADAADRRDAFLRGHRPPFFSPSPFSTSPRSFCNGGFLAEARNTRPLRHISTINGVSMRGKLASFKSLRSK